MKASERPRVSALITTFNHGRFVRTALESVLAQEADFPVEVIVSDDSSTDETLDVVRDVVERSGQPVRILQSDENAGDGGKRFFAQTLERCQGDYIALLDGDDFWIGTDKLVAQAAILDDRPDVHLTFHDVEKVDLKGSPSGVRVNPGPGRNEILAHDLLDSNFIASCSPMLRRTSLVPLPDWYFDMPWGDWPLYIYAATRGPIVYLDRLMGAYRVHSAGMWSGLDEAERELQLIDFFEKLRPVIPECEEELRRQVSRRYARLAEARARSGDRAGARRAAIRAILAKPLGRHHDLRALLVGFVPAASMLR